MRKTVTLIELILAMVLLMLIMIGSSSVDMAARYFFRSSDLKTKVINEASLILEHIAKQTWLCVGEGGGGVSVDDNNLSLRGFYVSADGKTLRIREDMDNTIYYLSNDTPDDISDDRCVEYVFNDTAHTVTYNRYNSYDCSGSVVESVILTRRLVSLDGADKFITYNAADPYRIEVKMKVRYDALSAMNAKKNPEVTFSSAFFIH